MTDAQLLERAKLYVSYLEGNPMECEIINTGKWFPVTPLCHRRDFFDSANIRRAQTPEQKRIEANAKLRAEWEKEPFPVQYQNDAMGQQWNDVAHPMWDRGSIYRRKPEPVYVPWTLATRPEGMVWVKRKDSTIERLITGWDFDGVWFGNLFRSYSLALDEYTLLNGSPCGTEGES